MEIVENMGDPLFWGAYAALWRFFAGVAQGRRRRDELNMCGVPTPAIEPPTERSPRPLREIGKSPRFAATIALIGELENSSSPSPRPMSAANICPRSTQVWCSCR
jgi:hypothetical protein